MKMYTQEERLEKVRLIEASMAQAKAAGGRLPIEEACKRAGIAYSNYYQWRQRKKGTPRKQVVVATNVIAPAVPQEVPGLSRQAIADLVGQAVGVGVATAMQKLFQ